jgi:hypothetical protein
MVCLCLADFRARLVVAWTKRAGLILLWSRYLGPGSVRHALMASTTLWTSSE